MKKFFISVFFALFLLFSFTGCYDAVFQAIRTEVELSESTVTGFVNGIVRFSPEGSTKQFLFLANGVIQVKDATIDSSGYWYELSGLGLPSKVTYSYYDGSFSGEHIFKMAADDKYVYALSYAPYYDEDKSRNVPKNLYLYACKPTLGASGFLDFSSGWHRVAVINDRILKYVNLLDSSYYNMNASIHLFCTNAPKPEHRKAYIRIAGSSPYSYSVLNETYWAVYELNGKDDPVLLNCASQAELTYDETKKDVFVNKNVLGAVWFNGGVLFTTTMNPATNETLTADPTQVYIAGQFNLAGYALLNSFSLTTYNDASVNLEGKVAVYSKTDGSIVFYEGTVNTIKAYLAGMSAMFKGSDGNYGTLATVGMPDCISTTVIASSSTICSMAVCSDAILLGTGSFRSSGNGIFKVTLDSVGTPANTTANFATNADSVMTKPYIVRSLLNVYPERKEVETILYSSMDFIYTESTAGTTIENRGVWSYYPSKLEWNRE